MRGRVGSGYTPARPPLSVVVFQMTRPELCRQKAIECEEKAKRAAPSSLEAEAWLKLAKQWREVADWIEDTRTFYMTGAASRR
jgi:hypothetical protein